MNNISRDNSNPSAIELFCGAGLLGEGFSRAGFISKFAADLNSDAVSSYNQNLKNKVAQVHDVQNVLKIKADIILAGPPCQGFSALGKRDSKDKRNKLSLILLDWANACDAKVIFIENVPQFLESKYFKILKKEFSKKGFESVSWVLNASEYGVAQHRKRSFTIFSKIGFPTKPLPTDKLQVKDAFSGLPLNAQKNGLHSTGLMTELMIKRIKNIPVKGGKFDLMKNAPHLCPQSWFLRGRQTVDVWGRMDFDKPSNTIRCSFLNPSKGRYIHPIADRVITLREGARLQGIPDSWSFTGSRTSIARQVGNGVPIPLAEAIANSVRELFI